MVSSLLCPYCIVPVGFNHQFHNRYVLTSRMLEERANNFLQELKLLRLDGLDESRVKYFFESCFEDVRIPSWNKEEVSQ